MIGSEFMLVDATGAFGPVYIGVLMAFATSCFGLLAVTTLPQSLRQALAHRYARRSAISPR